MPVSHATVIGRSHRLMQHNCQDFGIAAAPAPHIAFGLVCDGCGSKFRQNGRSHTSHNEIGANLLAQFTADFLATQFANRSQQPSAKDLEDVLADLYAVTLTFLQNLAAHFPTQSRRQFIATRLLTTIVGFIRTPETAVFFWQGDGFLLNNGRIQQLNDNNQPNYLAYQLLQPEPTQTNFQLAFVPQPLQTGWLAVASDGWNAKLLSYMSKPRSPLNLQRWLNMQAQQRGQFDDDGAVAMWHRG